MKIRLSISPSISRHSVRTPFSRSQSHILKMSTSAKLQAEPTFSSNYDPEQGAKDLAPLLKSNGGKWAMIESGKGIERGFKFKGFKKCWEFMNLIAPECVKQKHHPEWSNVYNTTFIRWTTHSPSGLSEKDLIMARFCDEKAKECGEVVEEDGSGDRMETQKGLVDRVASEGGDCCVPKGKK